MGFWKKEKREKEFRIEIEQPEIWDSGLKIVKNPTVFVPLKLQLVCKAIQHKIGSKEFSILCKGQWTSDGFEISEDYIIPEQEVTSSSVDYKEPLEKYKAQGYNVVIHSHPFSTHTDFSKSDEETINAHFDCSLLLNSNSEFVKAVIAVQVSPQIKLQIPATVQIVFPEISVPDEELAKIREKPTPTPIISPRTKKEKENKDWRDYYGFYPY